jgi:hypothetical protein
MVAKQKFVMGTGKGLFSRSKVIPASRRHVYLFGKGLRLTSLDQRHGDDDDDKLISHFIIGIITR